MLVSFWMMIMPAHQYASLDAKQGRVKRSLTCPNWCILYFKLQFAIVYFFATIAKLYPDWLAARPVDLWLKAKSHYPIVGGLFEYDWFPYLIAYGGLFYDGLIIPFLLFKRTRFIAIVLSLIFHLFNSAVFQVGIFPYFALAVAMFFFEPEQIRRIFLKKKPSVEISEPQSSKRTTWLAPIFITYFVIQLILPIRHHFIPGNVLWDESGHRLSWRMMLRAKYGRCTYRITYDEGKEKVVYPKSFLAAHQIHDAASRPDMLYRTINYLKEHLSNENIEPEAIYCNCKLSVNGRKMTTFVQPEYNMLYAKWNYFGKQEWIAEEPDLSVPAPRK